MTEPLHASNGHSLVDRRQLAKEGIVDDRTGDVTGFQKPRATVLVDVDGDEPRGGLFRHRPSGVSVRPRHRRHAPRRRRAVFFVSANLSPLRAHQTTRRRATRRRASGRRGP